METKDMLARVPNLDDLVAVAAECMINPELGDGTHGELHWRQTAEIARWIMLQVWGSPTVEGSKDVEICVVYSAALLHDIGRETDGADPSHATKGYDRALFAMFDDRWQPKIETPTSVDLSLDSDQIDRASEIIRDHSFQTKGETLEEQIVKDADKLGRFRLSPEGPDPARLALKASIELMSEAKRLIEENL